MAMFETTTIAPISFERAVCLFTSTSNRVSDFFVCHRKHRTIRRELQNYSPFELAELGIDVLDIDTVAVDLTRGQSTRCKLVDLGTKRILRRG